MTPPERGRSHTERDSITVEIAARDSCGVEGGRASARLDVSASASGAAVVLAGLAVGDELLVTAYERGYLAGAAAALLVVAGLDHEAAPDQDGRGQR